MYPESIKNLIESFRHLPGIGEKSAERMAFSMLELEEKQAEIFSESIINVKKKVHKCAKCNVYTEEELCFICKNTDRNQQILCILDEPKNVFLFEKMGMYDGMYHVLDGLISPLDGINPEDIGLEKLVERVKEGSFNELVFALRPSIEGETTALYIKRIFEDIDIKISILASGVPIGADMEYLDSLTLERALKDRKEIN